MAAEAQRTLLGGGWRQWARASLLASGMGVLVSSDVTIVAARSTQRRECSMDRTQVEEDRGRKHHQGSQVTPSCHKRDTGLCGRKLVVLPEA